ncbi:RNA-directed DNA polymerase (reverse transcriptase) domain containing protein [Plakobranchus ocellatus]|uniref:RNA-directed DNA polymerase (Reverse transcriptase) domain containing protein n=1 Tax=Plakobranchus ocellatus TaxID=259542 RepID=A0AAV3Z971_9GAST|nr:RNA-directed DNA polymerase (reverse transcriptase) domain containing protein [Plakobranchus ocellatus]
MKYMYKSPVIISCKIKLQKESLQLIEAYAPTTEYDDADVENFYEELENAMDPKCKYKLIIGDFNSKIGVKEADEENEWIGPFDKVIEQLEQRRKELRMKDNKTRAERVKYSEVNKTVKKKRRARARRKRKDVVISILQQRKGPKETHKYKSKKKISCMKDNDGHKTTDREEMLEICKSFYKMLYESTLPTPTNCEKESPDSDEVPPFTTNEVKSCLLAMSKKKAPGPDDITSDILLFGDEPGLKYLTSCFNEILKSRKIPACWEEAKIIIIYKKGDPGDIKNYRPISLLSHSYKLFTRLLQKRMERILDENQP